MRLIVVFASIAICPHVFAQPMAPVLDADIYTASHASETPIAHCELEREGTWVSADLLFWQAHMRSLDFAATEDGTSLAIGAGETHHVDFDRDAGVRVAIGHMTKVGWGVSIGYTNFETSGTGTVARPPGIGQLFSTLSHPGGPEEADTASANNSLDYNVFDLEAQMRAVDRRFATVDLFGGLRWANIDHELNVEYNGRDFVNGRISDQMNVDAFGLFVGGEAHWRMASGWSLFGRSSVAAMYGKIRNTRQETNLNDIEQLVDFEDEYVEAIFNIDTRFGLAKTTGPVQLRAGYDVNVWTGIGDRIRFSDDIEEAAFSPASGDLLLEGFFFQAAYVW